MTTPPPPIQVPRPGETIDNGRYELLRKLGAGGNGVVWLAIHVGMNSEAVVKFPNSRLLEREAVRQQFEQEVRSLVSFSNRHANIVNILDVGQHKGRPFVAMQYLRRGSLHGFVFGRQGFSSQELVSFNRSPSWLLSIADALDFVHANGLVHRDVKPANILLDDSFSAYLADFGIATLIDHVSHSRDGSMSESGESQVFGSLPYMPCEVLLGEEPTAQSDQFSLAVTTYEFLTGKRPFAASRSNEMVDAHQQMQVKPLEHYRPELAVELWEAIRQALDPNPSLRFDSCCQFAKEMSDSWAIPQMLPPDTATERPLLMPSLPSAETNHLSAPTESIGPAARPHTPKPGTTKIPLPKGDSESSSHMDTKVNAEERKIKLSRILRKKSDNK